MGESLDNSMASLWPRFVARLRLVAKGIPAHLSYIWINWLMTLDSKAYFDLDTMLPVNCTKDFIF